MLEDSVREVLAGQTNIKIILVDQRFAESSDKVEGIKAAQIDALLTVAQNMEEAEMAAYIWLRKAPASAVICVNRAATSGKIFKLKMETQAIDGLSAENLPAIINEFISWRSLKEN